MFPDFIKHYDMIRSILRDVFLYGCFSKSTLENKNKNSIRKINYEMRRIRQYIEKDFIKIDKDGKNKLMNLSYNNILNTKNFLVDTYLSKSFTRSDIILYYCLLLVLNYEDKPMTFSEIEDVFIEKELIDYDKISSKTIERKLKEMTENLEIVKAEKNGRVKEYSVCEDVLKELSNEEIEKLLFVCSLYKNIVFPNVSGYYTVQSLSDYMKFERNVEINDDDFFQYQYLHFQPVIEEELILKVMKAIKNRNEILIHSNGKVRRVKTYDEKNIKPVKLRYDIECGRFYIIGFCKGRCISARIDRKDDVEIVNTTFDYDKYLEKYKKSMDKSFSSVPNNNDNPYDIVKFKLSIDPETENFLINKIKGELGICVMEKVNDQEYVIEKEVNDAWEMIPWIRKYCGNIKVVSPAWLKKKINDDWKIMLSNYNIE